MLTQTQEELILIGGFGLFWLGMSGLNSPRAPYLPPLFFLSDQVEAYSVQNRQYLSSQTSPFVSTPRVCGPITLKAPLANHGGIGRSVKNVRSVLSAMLIAWQAYRNKAVVSTGAGLVPAVDVRGAGQGSNAAGAQRPCSPDAAYCVVEEWSYSYW